MLAAVVFVERGAADIRPVSDVLYADRAIAFFQHERIEGDVQGMGGAFRSTVRGSRVHGRINCQTTGAKCPEMDIRRRVFVDGKNTDGRLTGKPMMSPSARKWMLVTHIACSVAWIGSVTGFLVLAIKGFTSDEPEVARAAYISMNLLGLYSIVPLSLAALMTGLVQAFGTPWGLVRHYWVLVKLCLTTVATILLLLHQFTAVAQAATIAVRTPFGQRVRVGPLGGQLIFDATAGLVLLLGIVAISVFKPWGLTTIRTGVNSSSTDGGKTPLAAKAVAIVFALVVAVIIVIHLLGGGLHHGH